MNTTQGHWLETDPAGTPWRDLMLVIDLEIDREVAIERLGIEIVEQTETGVVGHEVWFHDDQLIWVSPAAMQDYFNNRELD